MTILTSTELKMIFVTGSQETQDVAHGDQSRASNTTPKEPAPGMFTVTLNPQDIKTFFIIMEKPHVWSYPPFPSLLKE